METSDFPSLSHKMPNQILGRTLDLESITWLSGIKTFFFFFTLNQVRQIAFYLVFKARLKVPEVFSLWGTDS